jgi:hypothetical protein
VFNTNGKALCVLHFTLWSSKLHGETEEDQGDVFVSYAQINKFVTYIEVGVITLLQCVMFMRGRWVIGHSKKTFKISFRSSRPTGSV